MPAGARAPVAARARRRSGDTTSRRGTPGVAPRGADGTTSSSPAAQTAIPATGTASGDDRRLISTNVLIGRRVNVRRLLLRCTSLVGEPRTRRPFSNG